MLSTSILHRRKPKGRVVRKIGQGQGQGHTARWWENQGDISHLARVHTRGRHASPVFAEAGHQPSLLAGRVFDQGVVITYLRTRPELPRKVPINPPAWHLGKPSASNVLLPTTQGSPPAAAPVPRFFSHWGTHTPRLTALVTKVIKQHLTFPQKPHGKVPSVLPSQHLCLTMPTPPRSSHEYSELRERKQRSKRQPPLQRNSTYRQRREHLSHDP